MPEYDCEAQNYLSSAVKLNPSYVEAWNELGGLVLLSIILIPCSRKTIVNTIFGKNCLLSFN